ncbi:MAG: hypothetical protein DA330_02045 [Nitrososphaera sp.]|nr:hypothetical protein [Nitrososphaera sp.]
MDIVFSSTQAAIPERQPYRIFGKDIRCFYPLFVIALGAILILSVFWMGSRYPALIHKAHDIGHIAVTSFIWNSELVAIPATASFLEKVWGNFANWLWTMKIGMSFGLVMGALLHTVFKFYPPTFGQNIYLNTLKGIIVGAPAGVCVNCAVPVACGINRGKANLESALSFMFSSPTLNVIVISIVFSALPIKYGIIQYGLIGLLLLGLVPLIVYVMNKSKVVEDDLEVSACAIPLDQECNKTMLQAATEVMKEYGKNLWSLIKAAVPMMILAAAISAVVVELVPFQAIFSEVTFTGLLLTALVSVFLPVPIALDVIAAHYMYTQGVPAPYVMVLLFTLGTYSILPMIFLWQEVSKKLSIGLYAMFVVLGLVAAYTISLFV